MKPSSFFLAGTACLLFSAATARGVVTTLTDPFEDGSVVGGTDNSGISWYDRSANSSLGITGGTDTTFNTGRALSWSRTQTTVGNRGFVGVLAQTFTLATLGDSISLAFDVHFAVAPNVSANGLTFGFYNSNGTTVAANDTVSSDNDFGLRGSFSSGGTATTTLVEEANGDPGGLGTPGGADTVNESFVLTTNAPVNVTDAAAHEVLFTLTLTAPGVITAATWLDGVKIAEGTNTTTFMSYDEIAFSQNSNTNYLIDNVVITADIVPEPGVAALLGAMVMFGSLRRRR